MLKAQRKIAVVTSMGKKYAGMIDVPNEGFRTTDLFNSNHIYWKNPNKKCYDDAILMEDVSLHIDDKALFKKFENIQIRIAEIIFLYDEIMKIHDEHEKKRADAVMSMSKDSGQRINLITTQVANSFYYISGFFFGMFLKKSRDRFVPLTQASVTEVYKSQGKWFHRKCELPHGFICFSNRHVESMTIVAP